MDHLLGDMDYKPVVGAVLTISLMFLDTSLPTILPEAISIIFLAGLSFILILTSRAMLPRYRLDHLIFVNWYVLIFCIFLGLVFTMFVMSV